MKTIHFISVLAIGLLAVSSAAAWDSVKTKSDILLGKIVDTSPVEIRLERGQDKAVQNIPVNQIEVINYSEEPGLLKNAKDSVLKEHYEEALNALARIKTKNKAILEDIEFFTALCTARLALSGNGKVADAGRLMIGFIKKYPESYHYFQACEVVGDLLVANRSYQQAEEYYAKIAKAPWIDYQMRSGVAVGRVLLAQGKNIEASDAFDKVIANEKEDVLSKVQSQAAKMGKASVLVAMQKADDAVSLIESIIQQTNSDDADDMARAYNILGNALRQQGKDKEALMAFMHVDLLYSSAADAHAEALFNLAELWDFFHKYDRAARARQTLSQKYKNSPWAQKGGQ